MEQPSQKTDKAVSPEYRGGIVSGEVIAKSRHVWAELLLLQLGLTVGLAAAVVSQNGSEAWRTFLNGQWQVALIALAAMSIGFGSAALLYQRFGHRQSEQLEEDYRALAARADLLLKSSAPAQHEHDSGSPRVS